MKKLLASLLLSLLAAGACAGDGDGHRTVMVNWKGTPYKAQILKSENGRHYVHYEGWPSSYDEWIMDSHIVADDGRQAAPAAPPQTRTPPQRIWVLWHGKPYEAEILKSESGRHFVHFPGWPSSYDEWIGKAQIIPENQARALLAKKSNGGAATQQGAYQAIDDMRTNANRLNQETTQQYRDTERHYDNKRLYGN
jgi:hypothetical protein